MTITITTSADPLYALDTVTLDELDQARLHDRVESKVLLTEDRIGEALDRLRGDYLVLEHDGKRTQAYRNDYFDSVDLRNYHEHHDQNGSRLKVRFRTYVNSDITFFEIKRITRGRTVKYRRPSSPPLGNLSQADAAFFYKQTGERPSALRPSLTVSYDRILLVSRDFGERVTIDSNVAFRTDTSSRSLSGIAICEFKQPRLDRRSPAMVSMNRRPQMFSKYCMGLASCQPWLQRNRFKKVFLQLETMGWNPDQRVVPQWQ